MILTNKCTCVPPALDLQLGLVRVYGDWEMGCPSRGGSGGGMGRLEGLSCSVGVSCSMLSPNMQKLVLPRLFIC